MKFHIGKFGHHQEERHRTASFKPSRESTERLVATELINIPCEDSAESPHDVDESPSDSMELFEMDELRKGRKLGSGGFADVYEIQSFQLHSDENLPERVVAKRHYLEDHAKRNDTGQGRYAIKCLQSKLARNDSQKFKKAAEDLTTEADLLAKIDHPNIVKVRACCHTGKVDGYFIVMDRLTGTLVDHIHHWKFESHRLMITPIFHLLDHHYHGDKMKELFVERLHVAYNISSALAYLHEEHIIYRDLKPENVGFDVDDHCKLFDFGLSRTLPDKSAMMHDVYKMSGKVGSLRYMAPEVWNKKPYNTKVDVYSFALLLWEILALEKPYRQHIHDQYVFAQHVFVNGERPPIKHSWPVDIQDLLKRAWAADMKDRPTMEQVSIVLKTQVASLKGGDYSGLHTGRKPSTHILSSTTYKNCSSSV